MDKEKIFIAPKSLLVREIKDYYTKGQSFQFNINENHGVGYIEVVGQGYDSEFKNKICYFNKIASQIINMRGEGELYLVTEHTLFLIRMDEYLTDI